MTVNTTGDYSSAPSGITADLSGRTVVNGAGGTDLLAPGITTLTGSTHYDGFIAATNNGQWSIDGGDGADWIAVYRVGRSEAEISTVNSGVFDLTLPGSVIHTRSVERINFIDGAVTYDPGSVAGLVVRLYQAALARKPDGVGLAVWTEQLTMGVPLTVVADNFLNNSEFQARFPNAMSDPAAFVTQLSENVFHKAPDQQTLTKWANALSSGQSSRAQVLVTFSEDAANYANTSGVFAQGIFVADEQAARVARMYYSALDRSPDFAGLNDLSEALTRHTSDLSQIAATLISSPEFTNKFGALNDLGYVDLIYHNVFGSDPDRMSETAWTAALADGTQTRASMLVTLSESPRHIQSLASVIETNGVKLV